MIVADNDVLVALFVDNEISSAAHRAREADPDWVVPELLRYEFVAVIRKYVRGKKLDPSDAQIASETFESFVRFKPAIDRGIVFAESVRLDMSPYDTEYLLLARSLGVKLLTNDGGFINRGLPDVIAVREFASDRR